MKKLSCLFLLFLFMGRAFGQSFEGQITYAISYDSKIPQLSGSQWAEMMGDSQAYFIKAPDYKSVPNGSLVQWQIYRSAENKLYTKMSNSESAFWNDAAVQGDEVLRAEVKEGVLEVLGYRCDELTLTCKSGIQKYYYHSKFPVDPQAFRNHAFGNWYAFVSRSKALPLKMILENDQFTVETTAVAVKALKIEPQTFELPAGMATEKSPY